MDNFAAKRFWITEIMKTFLQQFCIGSKLLILNRVQYGVFFYTLKYLLILMKYYLKRNIHQIYLKILLWGYNFYRNKNNQTPYMSNEKQRCKLVALLKPLKIHMY